MTTVLVANRGEIALRIFRTARRMGMRTVAVYSDADAGAVHVRAADEAVHVGPSPAAESYLRRDRIVEAARASGAGLVHPGYGFLAEDSRFAQDCADAGLTFVGPPAEVMRRVGDKAAAKVIALAAGVAVLPSYTGEDQSDAAFIRAAGEIGYPLIVKPSAGGGGKGMTVVGEPDDLAAALGSARRIARSAFDDDRLLLERYLREPRHIEVQVLADTHGRIVHLGERDCSVQRRHQKIVEEAPAPGLDAAIRTELHRAAVLFAAEAGYVGAGTCEFLVGPEGEAGLIEMNARLQVEHPVTEMVTGLDLVELQLRIGMGERLPFVQQDVRSHGHAVEARVYAEDPVTFLPQAGEIVHVRWGEVARVDAGVEEGSEVSTHYDPLIAKLVVHAGDRPEAVARLSDALGSTEVLGVRTNLGLLTAVASHARFAEGAVDTGWIEREQPYGEGPEVSGTSALARAVAAASELDRVGSEAGADPWSALGPWRVGRGGSSCVVVRDGSTEETMLVVGSGPYTVGGPPPLVVRRDEGCHAWSVDPGGHRAAAAGDREGVWHVWAGGSSFELTIGPAPRSHVVAAGARLDAPLPGSVVSVRVEAGQRVEAGDELVVIEAMKMEHALRAPAAGIVTAVRCRAGEKVDRGQVLVDLEPL